VGSWIHPEYLKQMKHENMIVLTETLRRHMFEEYGYHKIEHEWFDGGCRDIVELFTMLKTLYKEIFCAFDFFPYYEHEEQPMIDMVYKLRPLLGALDLTPTRYKPPQIVWYATPPKFTPFPCSATISWVSDIFHRRATFHLYP